MVGAMIQAINVHGFQYQYQVYRRKKRVVGFINNNDESAYSEEVWHLVARWAENNLTLNAKKTKNLLTAS